MTTSGAGRHPHRLPPLSSVLAVCAHPDDESFGLGAILDTFASGGATVSVLVLTRGEASTLGRSQDGDLREQRRSELHAAANELGVDRVELRDHPDGALKAVGLDQLTAEVATTAAEVGADLLLVFDQGGVTGHPDHCQATKAALAIPSLPVLAWTLPRQVADTLNAEFGTTFVGRAQDDIDIVLPVARAAQHRAITCHTSQSADNPPLWRRLDLLGDTESLRWLRPPTVTATYDHTVMTPPDQPSPAAEEWNRRYAATLRLFRAEPDETLAEVVTPLSPRRAVDLGAGEGRNSLWLAAQGWEVTAVDISNEALDRLDHAATSANLRVITIVDDITTYLAGVQARGNAFDLVVLAYLHPEPAERVELLHAATGAVAPGGHLFVVAHNRLSHGVAGPLDPARLYTEEDLRRAAHGLDVVQLAQRHGHSDIDEPGTDVFLWARRPTDTLRPAS